ncbi:MAG: type I DNA topoisomerase [Burkholderiales bacterium]|jgi:DNA topoisomerase-1
MSQNLLIVESPSKAKTLKKYLGRGFDILASYGHVRDLEAKEGAVDPQSDFRMRYALVERNKKHVDSIAKAVAKAKDIYLATDPDREGEAIAWHLSEILRDRKLLKNRNLHRVVFYEITESAVKEAVQNPREISMPLVNAQQARRALDHLVGFNLSPILWKKIGRSLSAGRVQSPALRLIVEREQEIENFDSREYWTIHLDSIKGKQSFSARLLQYRGKKVEQFTFDSEAAQKKAVAQIEKGAKGSIKVVRVERKPRTRQAAAPFITSTLQQEAVRKLGMTSRTTMSTAQQLYEGVDIGGSTVGLITYMRTDSVALAKEAVQEIRTYIGKNFDAEYLPKSPVTFRNRSKNAQEAHEAIRPTSISRTPASVKKYLRPDQAALYEMIWKRTLASQMAPARFDTTSVDLEAGGKETLFRASGQILVFPGFIAVYTEGADDTEQEEDAKLPALEVDDKLPIKKLYGEQHFTQPPPRYTEASLVKTLEEFGIGRPSTYANIISTLQDRGYAVLEKKRFLPTDVGRLVNGFLTSHFNHYLDYGFTANLEAELDEISNGEMDWVSVMEEFWATFASDLSHKDTISRGIPLPEADPRVRSWEAYSRGFLDPEWQETQRPELCPKCNSVVLLQNSSRGLFVGCSAYPDCDYTEPFGSGPVRKEPLALGTHKPTSKTIYLLTGPYGPYVQIGETPEPGTKEKPKRAAWPKGVPLPSEATAEALQIALKALSLPRQLGNHPETGKPVEVNIGRFGPYIKHDGGFKSIPKTDSVYDIKLDRAVELLAQAKTRTGGGRKLGNHPDDEKAITVHSGRYGPYLKYGSTNVTIPESIDPEKITVEEAVELIAEKAGKAKSKKKTSRTTTKPRKTAGRATSGRGTSTSRAAAAKKKTKPRRKST